MYTAIRNYCNNEKQNGLFLLDMPTGYGKTYSVLKYIHDASLEERNKERHFFFITTLKKNLPTDNLKDMFKESRQLDKFNEKFIFIDSNADAVIENLTPELSRNIPSRIKKTDEYKLLWQDVIFIQKQNNKSLDIKALLGSIKDNLRSKTEPSFRKMLQAMLAKEFPTVNDRIYAIKTNEDWQWLGRLYPAVFSRDKQIFFMSMDKFLTRNATIVEPSYMFYNSNIINNAVIFIDEFDATKETMLRNIIQNGIRDKFDYVELFKDIYSALCTNKFPAVLTTPSKERLGGKYKNQSLQGIIDEIRKIADDIYKTYSLQFAHRTDSELVDSSKNFIFQDHQFHSILDGNNSYISTISDSKRQINTIRFSKDKPNETNNIHVMLGKFRGFVSLFQNRVYILAFNYLQYKMEHRKKDDVEFTLEYAIRSVLSLFRLNSTYIDCLTSQILMSSRKERGNIQSAEFDLSFYEKGFRFYSFEDDSIHDMQSKIMMCSFQTTPEKILVRFCEKAKVIGISATATLPTVIGNFDINYLKLRLQDSYETLSVNDKKRIWDDFSQSINGYDKVKINVELLGDSEKDKYSIEVWNYIFKSNEIAKSVYDEIERTTERIHSKGRYARIALAYKNFINHEDIQSFLCVLTKHPKKGDFVNIT